MDRDAGVVAPAAGLIRLGARTGSFVAVRVAGRRPVVAGRADAPVLDDHGTVLPADAIRTGRRLTSEIQEVRIPIVRALVVGDVVGDAQRHSPCLRRAATAGTAGK